MLDGLTANAITEVAKHLFSLWNRRKGLKAQNGSSLADLIESQIGDHAARDRLRRQLIEVAHSTSESVLTELKSDFSQVTQGLRAAAMANVESCLQKTQIDAHWLVEERLDPANVYSQFSANLPRDSARDAQQEQLEHLTIRALAYKLCSVADGLPEFNHLFAKKLLENDYSLLTISAQILTELQNIAQAQMEYGYRASDPEYQINQQVLKRLAHSTLLGFDEKIPGVVLDLDTSYIELQFDASSPVKKASDVDEAVSIEDFLNYSKTLFVVGNAGSGKTTLLANLAVQAATNVFSLRSMHNQAFIPIFVRLRDFAEEPFPVGKTLFGSISLHLPDQLADGWVARILSESRVLFLIDGVDELPDKRLRQFSDWLEDLHALSPQSIFIITSRPLSKKPRFVDRQKFLAISVRPFGLSQIEAYLEAWHAYVETALTSEREKDRLKKLYAQLISHFAKNLQLARLAETPLMCAMICILNYSGKLRHDSGLVALYQDATRFLLHDRNIEKQIYDPLYEVLSYEQKVFLLKHVSATMLRNSEVEASFKRLDALINTLFKDILEDNNCTALDVAESLLRRSGVIGIIGNKNFAFLHKTFQEYFAAHHVVFFDEERFVGKQLSISQWREHFIFCACLLPASRANSLLEMALERAAASPKERAFLLPLIATCLDANPGIRPKLGARVNDALADLVPPKSVAHARSISRAGTPIIPHLRFNRKYSSKQNNLLLLSLLWTGENLAVSAIIDHLKEIKLERMVIHELYESLLRFENEGDRRMIVRAFAENHFESLLVRRKPGWNVFRIQHPSSLYFINSLTKVHTLVLSLPLVSRLSEEQRVHLEELSIAAVVVSDEKPTLLRMMSFPSARALMIRHSGLFYESAFLQYFPSIRLLITTIEVLYLIEDIGDTNVDEIILVDCEEEESEEKAFGVVEKLIETERRIDIYSKNVGFFEKIIYDILGERSAMIRTFGLTTETLDSKLIDTVGFS